MGKPNIHLKSLHYDDCTKMYLNRVRLEAAEVRMSTPIHVHVIVQPAIVRRFSSLVKPAARFRRKVRLRN